MIIFHKINTAGSEQQPLKTLCSSVPPKRFISPCHGCFPSPIPAQWPTLQGPWPRAQGEPQLSCRIAYSPVIHPHGLCLHSRLQPQHNSCAGGQSQHLHPALARTETCTPGLAGVPGQGEGAHGSVPRYSLLLDALILATSFCTPGMSPFFTAWISSCSRPIAGRWEQWPRRNPQIPEVYKAMGKSP